MPSSHEHPAPPVAATSKGGISHMPTPSSLLMLPPPLAMSLIPRMPPLAPNVATYTKPTSSVAHTLLLQQQQQAHFTSGTSAAIEVAASQSPLHLWHPARSCSRGILKPTNVVAFSSLPTSWHLQSPLHPWHLVRSSSVSSIKPTVPVALQSTHFT